jgi:hypothetical protein
MSTPSIYPPKRPPSIQKDFISVRSEGVDLSELMALRSVLITAGRDIAENSMG